MQRTRRRRFLLAAGAFGATPFVEAGGLLSYGANRGRTIQHSFVFVDRIEIPRPVLLRADRVIE